eukprot:CAMPEP_0170524724 /NCGR_PEP_ID=MMETSP0209-20121228/10199_1 /TAXON_ID=665100 ORGANISM="Litonotus pictus, Strain P1" /NCGR_SAMPLE_ID=MMETSP0209 /ASSEMBLY_ACC=CAM_ASM_000301 /LENGTH=178 /DNA_ID=CAMNT_0010813585 /DNA_START=11 /DNA_END=544 /DNA_ORIENTATION=+
MDGNRRFAKNNNIEKVEGHDSGLSTLLNFAEWCIALGISELTAYAFSIDNFNRTKEEVDGILGLIRTKFKKLYQEKEYFEKKGIKVVIVGKTDYFDQDIINIFAEVEEKTKNNKNLIINLCISYNSTEELNRVQERISEYEKEEGKESKELSNKKEKVMQKSNSKGIFERHLYCDRDI